MRPSVQPPGDWGVWIARDWVTNRLTCSLRSGGPEAPTPVDMTKGLQVGSMYSPAPANVEIKRCEQAPLGVLTLKRCNSSTNPRGLLGQRLITGPRYAHPIRMYSQISLYRRLRPKKGTFFRLQTIGGQKYTPWVADEASKMPDFERPAPKIPTPNFFLADQKYFLGGQKFKAALESSRPPLLE